MGETDAEGRQSEDEPESTGGGGSGPGVELPSPQAVVSELEEFLRQLRREDPGEADGE